MFFEFMLTYHKGTKNKGKKYGKKKVKQNVLPASF